MVELLREERLPGGKAAVYLLVYTAQGHSQEAPERNKAVAFTSLNHCSIKYCWIYMVVE